MPHEKEKTPTGSGGSPCYPFPYVGVKAYFRKSGAIVTVVGSVGEGMWTVEKISGKRMIATTEGLRELGPYHCLCKSLLQVAAGGGCVICRG
jgi:hypothetical protein